MRLPCVFQEEVRLTPEAAIAYAQQFGADGANAIFVMTTANYSFGLFLEMSQEIRPISDSRPSSSPMWVTNLSNTPPR